MQSREEIAAGRINTLSKSQHFLPVFMRPVVILQY